MESTPVLLGVLNVSLESMVTESIVRTPKEILERAAGLVRDGASIIDVGGRSITPDAPEIDDAEEQARLLPALEILKNEGYRSSVDTWSSETAIRCLERGADLVNFTGSDPTPELLRALRSAGAGLILTYMPYGDAYRMRGQAPRPYRIQGILDHLGPRIHAARDAGVDQVIVDPNLGILHASIDDYSKIALQHQVIWHTPRLRELGCPLLYYAARKPERLARIMMASAVLHAGPEYIRTHDPETIRRLMAAAQH